MKLLKRSEVDPKTTWDLTRLFKTEENYNNQLNYYLDLVDSFLNKYQGKLNNVEVILSCLEEYSEITKLKTYLSTYASLNASVDQQNETNVIRIGTLSNIFDSIDSKLSFLRKELFNLDMNILIKVKETNNDFSVFLDDIINFKPHRLSDETEEALISLSPVLSSPYSNYGRFKFADMKFNDFTVNGKTYPLSFAKFENEYDSHNDKDVRHEAFKHFYETLKLYENGFASNYQTEVLKQKQLGKLRNFKSTEEYLLFNQKVSLEIYNRQIDVITDKLRKPMRKYAKLLKKVHNLNEMTFKDLKLSIDPTYEPEVTINEAANLNLEALKVLGKDYETLVNEAINNRWIDYPQNIGKSTGGFCSSPYQKGSFILLNWNNKMDEAFVLAHEIGHAGHFHFAGHNQSVFNTRPSMYFIEAPSTINELILANHLLNKQTDKRFTRWVLATLISRTYYHNFVTHLLEAAYQREVYKTIDNNKPITAKVLRTLKTNVLSDFWGEEIKVTEDDGLTWMRQPHYFMGLYPYTYSAGLTISTAVHKKIINKDLNYSDWINVLKQGGSKSPLELASLVGVDLNTEKPLNETIDYISNIIDQIETLTKELEQEGL